MSANNGHNCKKFEVSCHAGDAGHLDVASDVVSVKIAQCIQREGKQELWGSVLVESREQDDGSLLIDVLLYHPEWDEPVTIASIRSNPGNGNGNGTEPALRFEFQQQQHA